MARSITKNSETRPKTVSYAFYFDDGDNEDNLIGILPERRKDKRRVTPKSIMRWGKLAASSDTDPNSIYYIKLNLLSEMHNNLPG